MTVTRPQTHRPVPRRRTAVAAAAGLVLGLVGVLAVADLLHRPETGGGVELPAEPAYDPRTDVACPEPQPREGVQRDEPRAGPAPDPVDVTSNDLYDCPETWHGRRVRYRGEVVGAVLRRGDGAWVQLNDDVYAGVAGTPPAHREFRGGNAGVGVLVPGEVAEQVEHVGGPYRQGDTVEVVGIFRRVDLDRHEVAVVLADRAEVLSPGREIDRPVRGDHATAAAVLAVLAAVVVAAERVTARRRR